MLTVIDIFLAFYAVQNDYQITAFTVDQIIRLKMNCLILKKSSNSSF